MSKFSIDYSAIDSFINKRSYKLADVKDKIVRIAFDMYKFKDGNPEELWQIQNAEDGDYIVAKYDVEEIEQKKALASANPWAVVGNKASGDINIFYKEYPITKIAFSSLGMPSDQFETVKSMIPAKLASDKEFVKALLKDLDTATKNEVFKSYPELSK